MMPAIILLFNWKVQRQDSLVTILQMVLVPSISVKSEGVSDSVLSGATYGTAMLQHVGAPYSQPIAPVTYMWRPHQQSEEEDCNNCLDVVECNEPYRNSNRSCFRQLLIWIHASAFSEGYDALKCACQKLMIERGVTISCFSREGQLAKLELNGSKAFQLLQKTVHPVSCIVENSWWLQKCSVERDSNEFQHKNSVTLEDDEHIPSCAILSFTIKDPRVLPAKETMDFHEPESVINMKEVGASGHVNLTGNLDKNEEVALPSCPKPEGNEILSDKKNLWDASSRIDPPEEENELCMEKHQQRMSFFCLDDPKSGPPKTSNKVQCSRSCPILILKNNNNQGSHMGWSVILPISWSKVFWIFLISKGACAIGLREKRWIACEMGLPYFPSDFPDCNSYLSSNEIEATASKKTSEQRPPAVRPFRIPIPSPWNVVHTTFDKLSMRVKEAQVSCGENMVGKYCITNSSCERSDIASFKSRNSFDGFVARTSSILTDFLSSIQGEHLLLLPQLQNMKSSFVNVMKDKSMMEKGQNGITQISNSHKLCFVRVHLHAYKEGVFEDGAVICAPCLTDMSMWTSRYIAAQAALKDLKCLILLCGHTLKKNLLVSGNSSYQMILLLENICGFRLVLSLLGLFEGAKSQRQRPSVRLSCLRPERRAMEGDASES